MHSIGVNTVRRKRFFKTADEKQASDLAAGLAFPSALTLLTNCFVLYSYDQFSPHCYLTT